MATGTAGTAARQFHTQQIHFLRGTFSVAADGGAAGTYTKTLGTIPAGSQIINAISGLFVNTAYNAGTSTTVDIGTSANDDLYMTLVSAQTKAFTALDEAATATDVNAWKVSATADTTMTAKMIITGTTASAGDVTILIAYVPPI